MDVVDFIQLFLKAKEKEFEKTAWEFWLVQYPNFTQETFVSFNDFLENLNGKSYEKKEQEQGFYIDQVGL